MRNVMMAIGACVLVGLAPAHLASAQKPRPAAPQPQAPPRAPQARAPHAVATPSTQQVLDDVQQTFGFVPQFLRSFPDALLPGFWASMKGFQANPNTNLDAKTKELIGLAVASQIPCHYCAYFHTAAARANGATDQEIKEAVGMAALTRMASTQLNGMQINEAQFKRDTDRILKSGKERPQQQAKAR